ncbi:beta-lactamase family protein [Nocardia sp. 2]|uniref:Beta-lactamase family protein n=1 Tax=Nocardia acididurans TaxID=2802282 RepID=A0ABS1M0S4_9NOCA|nr:serine hydrolase domain-containing protein [Nocardia acididurans]MBL1073404.1 beta-lactamase family protein [Nocardia acididurans]
MTSFRRYGVRTALSGLGIVAILAATACGTGDTGSEPTTAPASPALMKALNDLVQNGFPGAQVTVDGPGGHRTVSAGAGDLATGAPITDNSHVRIGSNTKTYVSTVLLQLVAEGKVELDAPVERYLPNVVRGNGNDGNRITVRQLLQHTTGLPEYLAGGSPELRAATGTPQLEVLSDEIRRRTYTPEELVAIAMRMPPQYEPGARAVYTNTNYILLGMLIEKVTGRPLTEEITTRILEPLHLRDTYFPAADDTGIRGPHPAGYQQIDGKRTDFTESNVSWAGAAGAMIATPSDLNRFFTALLTGKLLPPALLEQMKQTVPFDRMPESGYGLGLIRHNVSCGKEVWGHGGSIPGFGTRTGVLTDGTAVVLTVNQLPVDQATDALEAKAFDAAICG